MSLLESNMSSLTLPRRSRRPESPLEAPERLEQPNVKMPRSVPELSFELAPGTRVVRGPDWKWDDQDGPGGEGTVFEVLRGGAVRVCWDRSGMINTYRLGCEDRKLDVMRSPLSDSLPSGLTVGDKRRNTGVSVASRFGFVTVRWQANGHEQECRFGFEGKFEVRLLPNSWPSDELRPGTRVMRSRDWVWGTQDGGPGGLGSVEKPAPLLNWYYVMWDSGGHNIYRYSKSGKQDVEVHVMNSLREDDSAAAAVAGASDSGQASSLDSEQSSRDLPSRGSIVVRDQSSWAYSDQDGGPGSQGTVLGPSTKPGWVRVRWQRSGYQNDYRVTDVQVVFRFTVINDMVLLQPMSIHNVSALLDDDDDDNSASDELCIACCTNSKVVCMKPCNHTAYCQSCFACLGAPIYCPFCRALVAVENM